MKNILKFLFVSLLIPMLFTSCRDENYNDWTTQDPSFRLHDTSLGENVLYPKMENNPFVLSWDAPQGGASSYSVVVSATPDFEQKVELGTSATTTLKTTIGHLNTVMLQAGVSPYASQTVYVRVEAGTLVSNAVAFPVKPYPVAKPVITSPTSGSELALDAANPSVAATTIAWTDYQYATDVEYIVEIAAAGTTNYKLLGTVENATSLEVSNLAMDQAVLMLGGQADIPSQYDIRVTAVTESAGGVINVVSDVVTITVTPYQLESYIYAPGAYQGWDPSTANTFTSATSNNIYVGYINFPEANSEFKFTQNRNWDVSWGDDGGDGTLEPNGQNLKSLAAGSHKITVDLNSNTYTMEAYSVGLVGVYNDWGGSPDTEMTWDDAQRKFVATLALPAGDIKFRINNNWDVNYGDSNDDGILDQGGDNLNIAAAGTYTFTFDPINMTYTIN